MSRSIKKGGGLVSIWFADGSRVDCKNRGEWRRAPESGVQVLCLEGEHRLAGTVRELAEQRMVTGYVVRPSDPDRQFFTGVGEYDPLGWGVKTGSLLPDAEYWEIWEAAVGNG